MQLDLFLPEPTTEEFNGLASEKVQNTINVVLGQDEEVNIFNPEENKLNISLDFSSFDAEKILKRMNMNMTRPISSKKRVQKK